MKSETIDELFKEAEARIKSNPEAEGIGSISLDGVTLYSYQTFQERKKTEFFEILSHFKPNTIKEKFHHFIKKDKIIIKDGKVYYPCLEIPFETDVSAKEFYEKTRLFLSNLEYDLENLNPLVKGIYKIMIGRNKSKRQKYGFETEFFFDSKEDSRKLHVMGSVYKKEGRRFLNLTSESPNQIKRYSEQLMKIFSRSSKEE